MEDKRGPERGGDAAQQKTPRPECEESRPLSVEVRVLARAAAAASLAPRLRPCRCEHCPLREAAGSGGKFRGRMPRKHSACAGALPVHQSRGADWLSSLERPPSPPGAAASPLGCSGSLCLPPQTARCHLHPEVRLFPRGPHPTPRPLRSRPEPCHDQLSKVIRYPDILTKRRDCELIPGT